MIDRTRPSKEPSPDPEPASSLSSMAQKPPLRQSQTKLVVVVVSSTVVVVVAVVVVVDWVGGKTEAYMMSEKLKSPE
jgi:putative effector of murein hydrolase LrgA (UPF0299 family)